MPIDRPDPATYSQRQVIAAGGTPTWNSPDIITNSWTPWKLKPEARVIVRNLSTSASAANVRVGVGFSRFGIGMPVAALSSIFVSLDPLASATLFFPLSQALLAGDPLVSVIVRIVHPTDADPANNVGEQAIIGGRTSVVGRAIAFAFPVRNPATFPQEMTFVGHADTAGFTINPTSHVFAAQEQIMVHGHIDVSPDLHPDGDGESIQSATVVAFGGDGALVGGVTYLVRIDD